ncbi:MAG: hypothetical protein LIO72_01165, partial [Ruminococcus sp.]|nr:hypothetical protein [Ruminococcus sp.]
FKETEGGRDDMCKLMDDFKNEILDDFRNEITQAVAKDSEIYGFIRSARLYGITEDSLLSDVMAQFDLSESEAKSYMLKKSA